MVEPLDLPKTAFVPKQLVCLIRCPTFEVLDGSFDVIIAGFEKQTPRPPWDPELTVTGNAAPSHLSQAGNRRAEQR